MNPRLTKEFRPLLLPWGIAALAAAGHFVVRPDSPYFHGALGDFITGLAGFALVVGVLLLAALPMGIELQERTLGLLLSQPRERTRLWNEKLFVASAMIILLLGVHGFATAAMGRLDPSVAVVSTALTIPAACSVGYHVLATRSILVGIASAIGLPYAILLSTFLILHYAFGFEPQLSNREAVTLAVVASMVYSVFSLWLSQRQFLNLELRDHVSSRAAEVPAALVPKGLSALFRPRPVGVIPNLIRKEVCLHKPIFLVSAVLSAVWLLTLLLMLLRPEWQDNCVAVFNGLTGTQVVLMVILGGCVALGDDKALGTSAWHLTLPVSTRTQWLVKLLTAFGTTFAMAVILPTLLATFTLFQAKVGFLAIESNDLLTPALLIAAVFVLSFWSASMSPNTVRGALTGVLAFACIVVLAGLGASLSELLSWPFQSGLVAAMVLAPHSVLLVSVIAAFVALHQSYLMFRRGHSPRSSRIRYAVILALLVFLGSFWCADLNRALFTHRQQTSRL